MKKFMLTLAVLCAIALTACQSSQDKASVDSDHELPPVTPADQQRYNINQSTEEVINLDTTEVDSAAHNHNH